MNTELLIERRHSPAIGRRRKAALPIVLVHRSDLIESPRRTEVGVLNCLHLVAIPVAPGLTTCLSIDLGNQKCSYECH